MSRDVKQKQLDNVMKVFAWGKGKDWFNVAEVRASGVCEEWVWGDTRRFQNMMNGLAAAGLAEIEGGGVNGRGVHKRYRIKG
jgi:hypothetical protein